MDPTAQIDSQATTRRNARWGLVLFGLYSLVYLSYVLITAFNSQLLADVKLGGVNLAIWFGMGLIGLALVLALFYAWLCRSPAAEAKEGRP